MLNIPEYPEAERFFRFFQEFSAIPHGSGNTRAIADYLVEFARRRSLEYYRDSADNVIIRKPATPGYESRPGVIIQGHLDMVAEKKPEADIDMMTEGLTLYRDGDFLRAKDTTLGGDDGVALAYALALLDDPSAEHPDLEAVFTSDEEIGLLGAVAIDPEQISGRLLINIDSDVEGIFTVGCAGGMRSNVTLPVTRTPASGKAYRLVASGFKGGHSGVEIDKGRVNAVKMLIELLGSAEDIRVAELSGGNADNAIPRTAECVFYAECDPEKKISSMGEEIKARYSDIEPDITFILSEEKTATRPLDKKSSDTLLSLLRELPSGIIAYSEAVQGLVETSLNLGILRLNDSEASASFSVRSAKGTEKRALGDRLKNIACKHGADYGERGEYPAWEYRSQSHLRTVMTKVYEDMYGKSPEIVIIHAGLECGIFSEKLPGLDCVSIGPDNYDIHTTEERLSISSTVRVWKFLLKVLKEI